MAIQSMKNVWRMFPGMFYDIPRNVLGHSPECFMTFPGCLATFPGMFYNIPRNVWRHSPECLVKFPGMFYNIPQNIWWHSPECLRTFPGMFGDIARNVWRHSPEYNIPFIPRVPCIPLPVLVFLFLNIASLRRVCKH